MARVRFNPKIAARKFKKKITKATNNKALQLDIGSFITERIIFFARKGNPLNNSGKFPKLKKSTIKARRSLKGKKHPAFSPAKSNLTITGQLQDAIGFKRISGGKFEIFVNKSARDESKAPNNRQLSRFLEKIGFVLFTAKGLRRDKKITRHVKKVLLKFLKKELKS